MEKAVCKVCHSVVAQFLALIRNVVVSHAESAGYSSVLDGSADEDGDAAAGDFANELRVGHARMFLAVGFDLCHSEEVVLRVTTVLIDGVTHTGEEDETEEGAGDGEEPHDLVLAPSLVPLVE